MINVLWKGFILMKIIKNKALLLTSLLLLFNTGAFAITNHFWGDVDISGIYSDNVYRTSNKYGDLGLLTNMSAGMRTKFSKYTFSRINYSYKLKNFLMENIENNSSHLANVLFKQRLGEIAVINLNAGGEMTHFPNITVDKYLITQDSTRLFAFPELKFYPTKSTSLGISGNLNTVTFPEYDLDYTGTGISGSIGQEFSLYTYLKAGGSYNNINYSERYVYGITGSTRTNTSDLRLDTETSLFISLSQYISVLKSNLTVAYIWKQLTSNGNYFDFGPEQWEVWQAGDLTGDEILVDNYYSYTSGILDVSGTTKLNSSMKLNYKMTYGTKNYVGRLAKDVNDEFITPDAIRSDTPLILKIEIIKSLTEELYLGIGNLEMSILYKYENNSSNDYLYNYTANNISIFAKYYFSK